MAQYEVFESRVDVNGKTVLSVVNGVPSAFEQRARRILAESGIEDPDPDDWYSQQAWLDAFAEIDEQIGESTLKQIGKSIPDSAEWPDGVDSVAEGLASIDDAYQMNHRGGDIGYYDAEVVDDTTVNVECKNPYSCVFDRGIIEATAEAFVDSGVPSVTEIGDECRNEGGDACLYEVNWRA